MRKIVEQSWIDLDRGSRLAVTVSVGAARASRGESLDAIVARADARLYEAKNAGRNRSVAGE